MYKARRNVFETNSSSMHSITFSSRYVRMEPSCLCVNDDGYVHVELGYYGWGPDTLTSQDDKLSYLVTMVAEMLGYHTYCLDGTELEETLEDITESDDFKTISRAVADYVGCKGIILDNSSTGLIDHQSADNDSLEEYLAEWEVSSVEEFIFGNTIVNVDFT